MMGDFNGDGVTDLATLPRASNGDFTSGEQGAFAVAWGVGKPVNSGAPLPGFRTPFAAPLGHKYLRFCGKDAKPFARTATIYDRCSRAVIDFNGDGLDDIVESGVRITRSCLNPLGGDMQSYCEEVQETIIDNEAHVFLSLGADAQGNPAFAAPIRYRDWSAFQWAYPDGGINVSGFVVLDSKFNDFDGNGAYEDHYRLKNNVVSNRIEAVLESARRIDVQYSTLASNTIYDVIPADTELENELGYVKQTKTLAKRLGVKEIQVSNGIGGTNKTAYKYIGAKTHGAGYGDLGFATVEKLEIAAGQTPLLTIRNYYQTATSKYKLAGKLKRELIYTSDVNGSQGTLLGDSRYQWKVRIYNDDLDANYKSPHYFSYLYQTSNLTRDLEGRTIADSLTQNRPDATQSCDRISSAPSIVTVNSGAANDADYTADGVLVYSQTATCDESGSSASVQIKAVENLDITSKGDARGLVQKSKQYAWAGNAISSAAKSFYDVRTQSFTYNALGQLESKTIEPEAATPNSLKLTTNYLYNGFGSVRQITDTWDDSSNDGLDVNTRVTTIEETYTNGIRKLVVTKPLNISETTQFHSVWGAPTKQIDANGIETNTFHDNQGRPERINYADGTSTQIDYRSCNGCSPYHSNAVWYKQIKTTGSSAVRIYYDGFNREIGSRSKGLTGREVYTVQTYDSRGAPFQTTAPFYNGEAQKTVATYYDALGRVSSVTHPDGSSESRGYYGLRHTTTNRLNQTQTRYLNAAGWVMKSVDNANTPVDFTYWPWGDLKTTQVNNDPKTLVSVLYDKLGRKTEMTDPNTGKTTYTYNALDLIATQTDAKNQRTCFGYDALGRQTKRVDNASSSCSGTTQNWVYDTQTKGKGELGSMSGVNTDGTSYSEHYSYTNYGLPASTTSNFDGSSYTTTQHYDSYNRPLGVTYPTGYVAANNYNSYGHLDQVKDSTGATLWAANDADALGNLKQFTLGNGVVTTQTYDADTSRIESIRAVSGSLVIQDQHYQFDDLGNLRSREDRKNSITQSFCYDGLNRLKAARFNGCSSAANDYNYDPLGNLTTKEGLTGTLGYGTNGGNVAGPHAVTSANGWTYQYDEIGNLKTATKAGEQTKTVNYSPFNTPTSITQGSKFSTLVYGPNQDRIKHSDSNGRVTKYVGGIYEEVTKGEVTQKIHYVGDFALFVSNGENTNATYAHEYMHRDHIGSIVAISKGNIATVADVSWQANGAWGERRFNQWNGPLDNLLIPASTAKGFTDHEHLDAVGLIHMNGRVYDPELGRFMSADPFVQAPYNSQSYNRYSYVFNNPLSFTDPSGYQASELQPGECDRYGNCRARLPSSGGECSSGATCMTGSDAYNFGQYWQNYMNSYQESMVNMGGFWGGVGYTSIGMANQLGVEDALGAVDSALEGNVGGAIYGAAITVVKPLKAADKVADLAKDAKNGLTLSQAKNALKSGNATDKGGLSQFGKQLEKHMDVNNPKRNPDTWGGGPLKGGNGAKSEQGYNQFREIFNAPGSFSLKANHNGTVFLEKWLPDGRGVRLNQDGTFKGFVD
ncbi:MAG TPA: RHS repeat-associated core domain-containing protein [Cellvibrio sp.]